MTSILKPNIHILGIQGSGKGSQSALLVERYGLTYLASGNLFRERALVKDELGLQINSAMSCGSLLPDKLLQQAVGDYLRHATIPKGLLGDGVIRTLNQLKILDRTWSKYDLDRPWLIHLELNEKTAVERIEHRQTEQNEYSLQKHHLMYSGKLLKRKDDNPLAIQERFRLYHSMTEPIIAVFQEQQRYLLIDANQNVEAIHTQICAKLDALICP